MAPVSLAWFLGIAVFFILTLVCVLHQAERQDDRDDLASLIVLSCASILTYIGCIYSLWTLVVSLKRMARAKPFSRLIAILWDHGLVLVLTGMSFLAIQQICTADIYIRYPDSVSIEDSWQQILQALRTSLGFLAACVFGIAVSRRLNRAALVCESNF